VAEKIIIEFIGDSSKLLPTVELLERLGQIDAEAATSFKQSNAEMTKRVDVTKKLAVEEQKHLKTVNDLEVSITALSKATTAAYSDTMVEAIAQTSASVSEFTDKVNFSSDAIENLSGKIAEFSTQGVEGTQKIADMIDELEKKQNALRAASQRSLDPSLLDHYNKGLAATDAQLAELYVAMDKMQAAGHVLGPLGNEAPKAKEKLMSLRSELAKIREEMARVDIAIGKDNSKYKELEAQAGQLKDAMGDANEQISRSGSDTKNLDNVIQLSSAAAGGFMAAQGAASLFGSQNEFLQQSLMGVSTAMAIIQGLQQVGDVMSKRQFASIGALIGARQADVAATVEETAATSVNTVAQEANAGATAVNAETTATQAIVTEGAAAAQVNQTGATVGQTVATEGATVATRILNFVMKQNPVMWLIGGIAALVGLFSVFSNRVTKASATQKAFNDAQNGAADAIATEQTALTGLLVVAQDENVSRERRKAAFDELRQKYPEYLSNLNEENVNTKAVSIAIERQIDLIKKRAFAQAAADVYKDSLKKQIEAQNEMNSALDKGVGFWEGIWSTIKHGGALKNPNDLYLASMGNRMDAVKDATTAADGAMTVFMKGQKDATEVVGGTREAIQKEIDEIDRMSQGMSGFMKAMFEHKKSLLAEKLNTATPAPIDTVAFDNEKKSALALAQVGVDAAWNGSITEFNARRAMAARELEFAKRDSRLTNEEKEAANAKYLNDIEGLNIELRERNYRSSVAHFEAVALIEEAYGRKGSEVYYKAREASLRKSADQAKAQEGITAGEILKINAQLQVDLANLHVEKRGLMLQAQRDTVDAGLAMVKEGSQQELVLKQQSALIERDQQLNQLGLTSQAKEKIEVEYLKKVRDLNKSYNYQAQQDSLNAQQTSISTRLAQLQIDGADETNSELSQLKKDALDVQAHLEESSARNTITNQELLQARIKEIWTKAAADKQAIELQSQASIIAIGRAYANTAADNQIKDNQIALVKLGTFQFGARKKLLEATQRLEKSKLQGELDDLDEQLRLKLIKQFEYNQKKKELEGKQKETELQIEQEHQQRKQEILTTGLGIAQQVSDSIFEASANDRAARLDEELADLNKRKEGELNVKNLTEQQKADIEARYKAKERQIRIKAFEDEKQAKKQQALINGALAITNILATHAQI
jgi:hypothetical protein